MFCFVFAFVLEFLRRYVRTELTRKGRKPKVRCLYSPILDPTNSFLLLWNVQRFAIVDYVKTTLEVEVEMGSR